MLFLVELDHGKSGDLSAPEIGQKFIEQIILPTLDRIEQLVAEKKILAGGIGTGRISPRFIVEAESPTEIDRILFGFPLWPSADTRVTALVSFAERRSRVQEALKTIVEMRRKSGPA